MVKIRNAIRNILTTVFCLLITFFALAQGPQWWFTRGAVETNLPANDYALITQGQLKWLALNAYYEMESYFGAGPNVVSVVSAFPITTNYSPSASHGYLATIGQLKYVAQPFYDRLYELNLTNTFPANMPGFYPWGHAPATNDFALANIGQAKYAFSFDSAVDSDGDNLSDWLEIVYGTNPYNPNSDGDGLSDGWEVAHGLNPLLDDAGLDPDNDGLTNLQEYQHGTDPDNPDSDGDGLSDGDEVNVYHTDPNNWDTDGDGLSDRWEVEHGTDPLKPDSDADGLPDGWEVAQGLDPLNASDGNQLLPLMLEQSRSRITECWKRISPAPLVFTNTPGSQADLADLKNALLRLSGIFNSSKVQ